MPIPRAKWREPSQIGPLAILAAAAIVVLVLVAAGGKETHSAVAKPLPAGSWLGLVGEGRPRVELGQRYIVVLKAPSVADRVTHAGGLASEAQERSWTRDTLARQKKLLSRLAVQGVRIEPDFSYARVLDGFAAELDPRAVPLLERAPEVRGVYPVRATYPASTGSSRFETALQEAAASSRLTNLTLPGFTGNGVTIALLDTGLDRTTPYLKGRLARGVDIVNPGGTSAAQANPLDDSQLERHGTEMAGVLVGHRGPFGLHGIAPRSTLLPVRIAGWQPDAKGSWAVYGRSDQLIAGLEAAVDPNGDGDMHDAARIAVVGETEPYAAFADGPEARAVNGAMKLDTLVVVPVGNDGPAGPLYGSISGPAGAGDALAVGAGDFRTGTSQVRVLIRTGLRVQMARVLPLAGDISPDGTLSLPVAAPRTHGAPLSRFFNSDGTSRVAGRAALVPAGASAGVAVEDAARAGAYAALLYGAGLPAGSLGLDENVTIPVVALPRDTAQRVVNELGRHRTVSVAIGSASSRSSAGGVAGFSSRGLAFDGRVKPDLIAPGVAVPTSDPGEHNNGSARFGTVNGSSVAAATTAGALALLAEARPALNAFELKGVLTGAARPLRNAPVTSQGAGLLDLRAAASAPVSADPATLALAPAAPGHLVRRTLVVHNVSGGPLKLSVEAGGPGVGVAPRHLELRRAKATTIRVWAHVPRGKVTEGALRLAAGGSVVRVPWVVGSAPRVRLLSGMCIAASYTAPCTRRPLAFKPSDTSTAVLAIRVGQVVSRRGLREVQPVSRLEITLRKLEDKKLLGTLVELRDLLPGQYAFALTGRGPAGEPLVKGPYRVKVTAWPAGPGAPTDLSQRFTIKK
jgi:subtilase family protein/peptidase inhibitor I9